MDIDVQQRLAVLVDRACDKRHPALDCNLLSEIKFLCKQADENVLTAWEALWAQLRAPHSQTRLLALLLCEQLFQRSRAFRLALLDKLNQFLEAVVGCRADRPLPPPPAAAASLKEKALELLAGWEAEYGGRYRQLPLAVRYLRDNLQYNFPSNTAARAASRQQQQRGWQEQRRNGQQRQLRERLAALLGGGSVEWQEGAAAASQLLAEMEECFAILEEQQSAAQRQESQQQQQQQQQGQEQEQLQQQGEAAALEPVGGAGDGLDWEDVAALEPTHLASAAADGNSLGGDGQAPGANAAALLPAGEQEGLAAYAGADDEESAAQASPAAVPSSAVPPAEGVAAGNGGEADTEAVTETLAGLYRQLVTRVLPQVQEWVQVLGRADAGSAPQEQQQLRRLRQATELRARLAAVRERCDASALDLQALLLRRRRRERLAGQDGAGQQQLEGRQQQQQQEEEPAVAAALQELFGDGSSGDEEGRRAGRGSAAAGPRPPQQQQRGSRASREQQQQASQQQAARQRRRQPREGDEEAWESPYLRIVDPAAPRPIPLHQKQQQQPQPQQRNQQRGGDSESGAAAAGGQRRSGSGGTGSTLPEEVRRKLAAQAPTLPSGLHTIFWDSGAAPTYVSGHGLEVSNHWGPVDVHKELPQERLDEIFMIAMPASHAQQAQQAQQQAQQGAAGPGRRQQQQQGRGQQQDSSQGAAGSSRQQPGAFDQMQQQREQDPSQDGAGPSRQQQDAGAQPPPPLQWPSRLAVGDAAASAAAAATAAAAIAASAPGAGGDGGGDARSAKRARRAQERAYNEAVIGGLLSDDALARQLQEAQQAQQAQQQPGGQGEGGGQGRGRGRGRGKKMDVRSRLAQKLLRGRAVAAAVADATLAESEAWRDKFGNRW